MTDCLWELQEAVFVALDGDGTLSGLVTGIYSHVPQDTAFPYVRFNVLEASDWSTKTNTGIKARVTLDIFSRERGSKDVLDIMVEIKRILNGATLSMTGYTMVSMKFADSRVNQLSDGLSWQGSIGFSVLVQKD